MEEAAAVRRAASEAVADVVPDELRETIDEHVDSGSVVPGVLTLLSARAVGGTDPDGLLERAAGVQLIYDGLRLTRELARTDPWSESGDDADVDILAADVLVARGFYLLARTDAAEAAVGVVRSFGRDQTVRERADRTGAAALDRNLEADVLELALLAGVTAAGGTADGVAAAAADMAPEKPSFDAAGPFFESHGDRLATLPVDGGRPLNRND